MRSKARRPVLIGLQAEGVAIAGGHDQPRMGVLHPDPNAQLETGSGHKQSPQQGCHQPTNSFSTMLQQRPSQSAENHSVPQSKAASGGLGLHGREGEAFLSPADSQATDFSRFSLGALPSSRKLYPVHHQSSFSGFKACLCFSLLHTK